MKELSTIIESSIKCPTCGSAALYRYGRAHTGKRRFLCLMCNRQFTITGARPMLMDRPKCPTCGRSMNIYKREEVYLRFRCSGYPKCKTYKKHQYKGGVYELLRS